MAVKRMSAGRCMAIALAAATLAAAPGSSTGVQSSLAAAPPSAFVVPNGGFEEGAPGAPPSSWQFNFRPAAPGAPAPAYRAVMDSADPHRGRASVRVERTGNPEPEQPPFASLSQRIDAGPYRGRRIRFSAAIRAGSPPAQAVGLWLRVDRAGGRRGFFDNMGDRPITSPRWANYSIEGDVARDAEHVYFGLLFSGTGQAWMDEVRVEVLGPATTAASPAVTPAENLDAAIALLREHHINSRSADWPRIAGEARARIAGASDPRDSYDAIQFVIDALGERHTLLRPEPAWERPGAAARPSLPMPHHELVDGRFGLVRLPGFMGSQEEAARYVSDLREGLEALDGRGVCGWIVDLRDNSGGNMWPMLNGLDPLLGDGPFGSFRSPAGRLTHWVRTDGGIQPSEAASARRTGVALRMADMPVALLLGPRTASSGEMTAMSLIGRANVRSFGTPTAGYSTANRAFVLPDGARLAVTTSYARDRTGREYAGSMQPDEPIALADAPAAAKRWLETRPCRR